jgi:N-acetylglucosamine kinase-like BadF-type ATPase
MQPVLGVEGGGSHCHAVVADASGEVLGVGGRDDSANWEDVGIEAASAALRACVGEALGDAAVRPQDVSASVFALAGIDFPVDEQLLSGIPVALRLGGPNRLTNDAYAALRAGTDLGFGVVAVAGTGSVVAGRNPEGEEFRTLGLGPMFGDSGSASEVSEAGVTAVSDAFTGRGPETALTEMLCASVGVTAIVDFLEGVARDRIDATGFAPLVVGAADDGDAVAQGILGRAGQALGEAAAHVVRRLRMDRLAFDLVLAGGMFRDPSPFLPGALEETVSSVAPGGRIVRLQDPPVVGAVLLGMELAGVTPAPETREALARRSAAALRIPTL